MTIWDIEMMSRNYLFEFSFEIIPTFMTHENYSSFSAEIVSRRNDAEFGREESNEWGEETEEGQEENRVECRNCGHVGEWTHSWITVCLISFLPSIQIIPVVTFCLGCWQVGRLQWKLALIDSMKQRLNAPAIDIPEEEWVISRKTLSSLSFWNSS